MLLNVPVVHPLDWSIEKYGYIQSNSSLKIVVKEYQQAVRLGDGDRDRSFRRTRCLRRR